MKRFQFVAVFNMLAAIFFVSLPGEGLFHVLVALPSLVLASIFFYISCEDKEGQ